MTFFNISQMNCHCVTSLWENILDAWCIGFELSPAAAAAAAAAFADYNDDDDDDGDVLVTDYTKLHIGNSAAVKRGISVELVSHQPHYQSHDDVIACCQRCIVSHLDQTALNVRLSLCNVPLFSVQPYSIISVQLVY